MGNFARFALTIGVAALFAGCGGSASPPTIGPGVSSDNANGLPYHKTFHYTGAEQSFKVPAGVQWLHVDVRGAAGAGYYSVYYGPRGRGGRLTATIAVYPDQTLFVFVGGEGSDEHGGFNGGGNGGYNVSHCNYAWGAGGASDVRAGQDTLQDRILVAGGGGGSGSGVSSSGANGGSGGGKTGGNGTSQMFGAGGGGGGKQHTGGAGGAGGKGRRHGHRGTRGQFGTGGDGGACGYGNFRGGSGGGGGGGYFGGGGGGGGSALLDGGGGGGGSGYVESSAINARMWRGWKTATGNGLVVFSWQ